MNGKKCSSCEGSGFIICVDWIDDGYNDYPGTRQNIGDPQDMRRMWRETCGVCHGHGYYHYGARGELIPGYGEGVPA